MRTALLLTIVAGVLAGCTDPRCDAAALSAALASAAPGETVEVGACRVRGTFTVPAGVVLTGVGPDSILEGSVSLEPGADRATTLRALTVESASGVAVRASGEGAIALTDLDVLLATGIGIGVRDADRVELTRVRVRGPITRERANDLPPRAGLDVGAYGLALLDAGAEASPVAMVDVTFAEVGPWGAIVSGGHVRWNGGGIDTVVGTGLYVEGADVRLEDVELATFLQGVQTVPAYGIAAVRGARVETLGVTLSGSEGIGLLHAGTRGLHTDLTASNHRFGAVWLQDSDAFELRGASALLDNRLAGLVAVRSSGLVVEGAMVRGTRAQLSIYGETPGIETADGVQVLAPTGAVTLRDVALEDNGRVGVLVDVGAASLDDVSLSAVRVSGSGDALGAIAQTDDGVVPSGTWDSGVTRTGAPATNDAALTAPLPVPGALTGGNVPVTDVQP
jgi:hypothetical protein